MFSLGGRFNWLFNFGLWGRYGWANRSQAEGAHDVHRVPEAARRCEAWTRGGVATDRKPTRLGEDEAAGFLLQFQLESTLPPDSGL